MLSYFSAVQLLVTLWTVASQTPLSMGCSRQEYWSWIVIPFSRGSSHPIDGVCISYGSYTAGVFFTAEPYQEAKVLQHPVVKNSYRNSFQICLHLLGMLIENTHSC